MDCDLRINIQPQSGFGSVISVLVAYDNPSDINTNMTQLPTWQSDTAAWTASLKSGSIITIEGSEPYFFEHNGQLANKTGTAAELKATSIGYYYIAVQSYEEVSYTIQVDTVDHDGWEEFGTNSTKFFDIDEVFLGPQDSDFFINAGMTKYFYFKNWREEDIQFSVKFLNRHYTSDDYLQVAVGAAQKNDKMVSRAPEYESDLPQSWLFFNGTEGTIKVGDPDFCNLCTYVLRVTNNFDNSSSLQSGETKFQVILQQLETHLDPQNNAQNTKSFKNQIYVGRPQPLKLERNEVASLYFKDSQHITQVDAEILLGDVEIKLYSTLSDKVLQQYPCDPQMAKDTGAQCPTAGDKNLISFTNLKFQEGQYYYFTLTSISEIFQGVVYLRDRKSLTLLSDGALHKFKFTFQPQKADPSSYFMYLPTSHKSDLLINSQLSSFESDVKSIYNIDDDTNVFQRFFNFKVAIKVLSIRDDLHAQNTAWTDEFTHDEQFDFVYETRNSHSGTQIF
jgi:hypothetical protein